MREDPDIRLDLRSIRDRGAVEVEASVRHEDDVDLSLGFDVHRSVRFRTTLSRVLHRLGHQPLDHFTAVTNHGRVTRHTDLDPASVYEIDYQLLEHRTEFQPRAASDLTLAVEVRRQEREGTRQATTVSHCDSCHVVSQGRRIDESTTDGVLEAQLDWAGGSVTASFARRELEEGTLSATLLFDDALHPELRLPLFDNRLQFDSAKGPQPVDLRPDINKDTLRLDSRFHDVGGFLLTAGGVWSTTENDFTGLASDYSGYLLTAARAIGKDWHLRWRGRSYTIDNDDVFVDVVERTGIAGPQAGGLYSDFYDFEADYLRLSALDRDVLESRLDLTYRLGKKAGKARFFWEYEEVDRDHYRVAPGDGSSATHVLGASWWARPRKGWKTRLSYEHGETDDPFMLVDGAFSTLTSPAVPNPFDPAGAQYYQFHEARIADVTASPSSWDEVEVRGSYTRGNSSLSGSYRCWDGDNGEGDLTDWSRNVQSATVTLWSTPAPEWEWHLAYAWNRTELDAPYLYDTSGTVDFYSLGVGWSF